METCNCCTKKLLTNLAGLQSEVGSDICTSSPMDLSKICMKTKPEFPIIEPSKEKSDSEGLEKNSACNNTTSKITPRPFEPKSQILKNIQTPQGVLILDRRPVGDKFTCRFCKTLVKGTKYRGKEIVGFEEFSQHLIDVHNKIVLISSYTSENGDITGVHLAKSTEAVLESFERILSTSTESNAPNLKSTSTTPSSATSGIRRIKRHPKTKRKLKKPCQRSQRSRSAYNRVSSHRRKIISQIRLRKHHNRKSRIRTIQPNDTATQTDMSIIMSSPSNYTSPTTLESVSNTPDLIAPSSRNVSCISEGVQCDPELSKEGMVDKENQTVPMSLIPDTDEVSSIQPNQNRFELPEVEDIDSENESIIIDVGSENEASVIGIPLGRSIVTQFSVVPEPMNVDEDVENDESDTNFMEVEMDDQNTVTVIPILIEEDPTSSDRSSSASVRYAVKEKEHDVKTECSNYSFTTTLNPEENQISKIPGPSEHQNPILSMESSTFNDTKEGPNPLPIDAIQYDINDDNSSEKNSSLENKYQMDKFLRDLDDFLHEKIDQVISDIESDEEKMHLEKLDFSSKANRKDNQFPVVLPQAVDNHFELVSAQDTSEVLSQGSNVPTEISAVAEVTVSPTTLSNSACTSFDESTKEAKITKVSRILRNLEDSEEYTSARRRVLSRTAQKNSVPSTWKNKSKQRSESRDDIFPDPNYVPKSKLENQPRRKQPYRKVSQNSTPGTAQELPQIQAEKKSFKQKGLYGTGTKSVISKIKKSTNPNCSKTVTKNEINNHNSKLASEKDDSTVAYATSKISMQKSKNGKTQINSEAKSRQVPHRKCKSSAPLY